MLVANEAASFLDHGQVVLLEVMGSDESIDQSARMSYQGSSVKRKPTKIRNLLRYLLKNGHTSPFEMAQLRFAVRLPLFIDRQFVRHRTFSRNEVSARYTVLEDRFYIPALEDICTQSEDNKQGSGSPLPPDGAALVREDILRQTESAYACYQRLLDEGVARELARIVLPLNVYTEMVVSIDLHNLFNFLRLRVDKHAQKQIRDFANAMYSLVKPHFPIACEAFEDYVRDSIKMSAKELDVVRRFLDVNTIEEHLALNNELSSREAKELLTKLRG